MIQVSFSRVKLNIPQIFSIVKIVSRSVPWKMLKMFVRDNQLKTISRWILTVLMAHVSQQIVNNCQAVNCFIKVTYVLMFWPNGNHNNMVFFALQQKQLVFLNKRLDAKCSMAVFVPFIAVDLQLSLFIPTNIFTKRL